MTAAQVELAMPAAITVLDPDTTLPRSATLRPDANNRLCLDYDAAAPHSETMYLSPGWVDLHAHVYDGVTQISVRPDRVGLDQGVHLLADAGSAGQATVRGLIDYVIPTARTTVKAWLNIGSHGLVHLREVSDISYLDVDATLAAISSASDILCGIKVRSSGAIVGALGLQPLRLARLAAREAALPLLVHVGEAPPDISEVLDLLDDGDVVTHCYHGKTGNPWRRDGSPTPALQRALDRGVLLDVGHGAASFDIDVARAAVAGGYPPHSISTDIHVRNIAGPVYSLAAVMTKMLDCGLPLRDVISSVTSRPRRTLRANDAWIETGMIRHATLFRLDSEAPPGRRYVDSGGKVSEPDQHLVPVATIVDGTLRYCGAS